MHVAYVQLNALHLTVNLASKHTVGGVREPSETALVAVHDCTLGAAAVSASPSHGPHPRWS